MSIPLALLHAFGGIVWLLMAGDILVRGALALAARVRIQPAIVGLTVVALGTSAPELVVSVRAVLLGYPDLAIGNVVGSNIANVLMVVGLPAIAYPMTTDHPSAALDAVIMFLVSVVFVAMCARGPLGRAEGVVLLLGLVLFLFHVLRVSRRREDRPAEPKEVEWVLGLPSSPLVIAAFLVFGGVFLPVGAELLIRGGVAFAERLGLSNSVVGLTIFAVGTSLPELATTLVAAFKREAALAVANVVGSNVMNILAIAGAAAIASPGGIPIPARFLTFHLPVMLMAAAALTWVTLRRRPVGRAMGAALLAGYALYTVALF